jgi:hypothetical protein
MPVSSGASLYSARPSVSIHGPAVVTLTDIISIRLSENLAQANVLEVCVNNWGMTNGQTGYLYSDGNLLHIGASISLNIDRLILAEGTVTALAPGFPSGSAPTFTFMVDARRPPQRVGLPAPRPALEVSQGQELREFYPILHKTVNSPLPVIDATGTTDFLPDLTAGTILKINGVGANWSGEYAVTETTLTFDLQSGWKISFTAQRHPESRLIQPLHG